MSLNDVLLLVYGIGFLIVFGVAFVSWLIVRNDKDRVTRRGWACTALLSPTWPFGLVMLAGFFLIRMVKDAAWRDNSGA